MQSLSKTNKMRWAFIIIAVLLWYDHSAQAPSTRRRSGRASAARPVVTTEDCVASGCPCCIFLSRRSGTVCKSDHSEMENVEESWGSQTTSIVNGRTFKIFNANAAVIAKIEEILNVLPSAYLDAVPGNFRIGNPRNGNKNVTASGTVGGGSRRCFVKNPEYEYIIIHPEVFTTRSEDPILTILHEIGHFVDREYGISQSMLAEHGEQFRTYLSSYSGDSRGNDEVIAQGIMYYFKGSYWPRIRRGVPVPLRATSRFPQWLMDIIINDINSRS